MRVLLTRSVGIRGEGYAAGEMLDLDIDDAKQLVSMGKAVFPVAKEPESVPRPRVVHQPIGRGNKKEETSIPPQKKGGEEAATKVENDSTHPHLTIKGEAGAATEPPVQVTGADGEQAEAAAESVTTDAAQPDETGKTE